jgi:hypothetical protein
MKNCNELEEQFSELQLISIRRRAGQRRDHKIITKAAVSVALLCNIQYSMPRNEREYRNYLNMRSLYIRNFTTTRDSGRSNA